MRVGQTFACGRCALRFARVLACPECGSEALFDLRDPAARKSLARRLGRLSLLGRILLPLAERGYDTVFFVTLIVVVTLAAMVVAMISGSLLAYFGAYLVVPIAGTVAWVLLWPKLLEHLEEPKHRRALRIHAPPRLAAAARTTLGGTVRGESSLVAPLSGRACVAYRLVGRVGDDAIDDAAVSGSFEIELDEPDAKLELDGICFELPAPSPERTEVGPVLAPLLSPLLAIGEDGVRGARADLAEAILVPGDRVEVEGHREARTAPDGYRGTKRAVVLAVHGASPLRIRPARPE